MKWGEMWLRCQVCKRKVHKAIRWRLLVFWQKVNQRRRDICSIPTPMKKKHCGAINFQYNFHGPPFVINNIYIMCVHADNRTDSLVIVNVRHPFTIHHWYCIVYLRPHSLSLIAILLLNTFANFKNFKCELYA